MESLNAKYGYDVRAEIYETDGMVNISAIQRAPVVVYTRHGTNAETSYLRESQMPQFAQRSGAAYLAEKIHFTRTIQEDLAAPSLEDGRAALDICFWINKYKEIC